MSAALPAWLPPLLVGVLPVLCFVAALRALDSFKLVRARWVLLTLAAGALMAAAAYLANGALLRLLPLELPAYSRYVAPLVEEGLKGLFIAALVRTHRIGFGADAAILGFALGAGFASVENIWFVHLAPEAQMLTWIVRGFGTALMHGGATAAFAVMGLTLAELHPPARLRAFAPGLALAAVLHSAFNHLAGLPMLATLVTLLALPLVMGVVFQRSEQATRQWLGSGFDSDVAMLEAIRSGALADSPVGRYLHTLRDHMQGPMLADVLGYLRLYTELSLRAKGLLMMRENGFEVDPGDDAPALLEELRHLEQSIGRTGLHALRPLLRMRHKDLWQLYSLQPG